MPSRFRFKGAQTSTLIYVCFVDYPKAFDRVKHDELISLLEEIAIGDKDQRIIKNIYHNQTVNIRVDNQLMFTQSVCSNKPWKNMI